MKRALPFLLLPFLLLVLVATVGRAQWEDFSKKGPPALVTAMNRRAAMQNGTAVPTLLDCTQGHDLYMRTGTVGLAICDALNHWTFLVSSVYGRTGAVVATTGDYNTGQVTEVGNLYYLDSRARAAFSATAPVTLSAGGVIACPTCKVADAVSSVFSRTGAVVATSGDYNTGQVSEVGNLYYLDSRARAAFSATAPIALSAGGVISCSTCKTTDAVSSVFGRTGVVVAATNDYNTSQVNEVTNLYYTDVRARAASSATLPITYSGGGVIACPTCKTTDSQICGNRANTNQAAGTSFLACGTGASGTEGGVTSPWGGNACTARRLQAYITATQPNGTTYTFTLRRGTVSGSNPGTAAAMADTALTFVITGTASDTTGIWGDYTHTVALAATDVISISAVCSSGTCAHLNWLGFVCD